MKKVTKQDVSFSDKWSPAIEDKGYVQVPNLLIEHQDDLGITSPELVFLIGLLMHKWDSRNPFPSLTTVGAYSGKKRNTAQAAARSLEKKGFILRISRGGNETNEYDLAPLIDRLESCTQAVKKMIPTHRKVDSSSHRKIDNEEYHPNKTQEKRRRSGSGKLVPLKDVLMEKFLGMANKS